MATLPPPNPNDEPDSSTNFNMENILGTTDMTTQSVAVPVNEEAFVKRKSFFVNPEWELGTSIETAKNIMGQMYVESLEPLVKTQPYPIVLIHGDYHTGQIWLTKPDGNPGWASYFNKLGYHVYIVDLPPFGRSNYMTEAQHASRIHQVGASPRDASFVERELTAPGKRPVKQQAYAKAKLHDKWPGSGQRGDPIFNNYCASLVSLPIQRHERQTMAQIALQALLKVTGKVVLVGQGAGATAAWLATDVQPELVHAVVAVEPSGPPCGTAFDRTAAANLRVYRELIKYDPTSRSYGLTDIPISYDPPANLDIGFGLVFANSVAPLETKLARRDDGKALCILQKEFPGAHGQPAFVRKLFHIGKVPHAIVTAQASPHSTFDWATVEFMRQAGASVDWLNLEQMGILGNGHLMFLETNSDVVAGAIDNWIRAKTGMSGTTMCMTETLPEPTESLDAKHQSQEPKSDCGSETAKSPCGDEGGESGSSGSQSMDFGDTETEEASSPDPAKKFENTPWRKERRQEQEQEKEQQVAPVDLSLPAKPAVSFPVTRKK